MENDVEPTEEKQVVKPVQKTRGKAIVFGVLILLLLVAAAGGAWWLRDRSAKTTDKQQTATISSLQQTTASLKTQLAAEKAKNAKTSPTASTLACTPKAPGATTISNIEASITSGNTAALEGYMAPSVNVIIAASEGLGAKTPTQAVSAITNFISNVPSSWDYDFALPASVLSSYGKGSYSQYFPSNAVVGKATNKKVIAFSFDCNAKISTVFVAADESLLK
ncbi:MAG: hypothetical protein WC498_00995 [Candidatus Saccharimonadales bacterium]